MKHSCFTGLILFCAIVLFLPGKIHAQKSVADSLENVLKKPAADSVRIDNLLKLSKINSGINGDKALQYADEALTLSVKINDLRRKGLAINARGNAFLAFFGELDSAAVQYERVLELSNATNDKYLKGFALNNLGNIAKSKGDVYKAQRLYEQALEIRTAIRDSSGMAGTMSNLGAVYQQKGDFKRALDLYYAALPIKQKENNPIALATTYENLGLLHLDRQEPKRALEMLEKAAAIYRQTDNNMRLSKALNGIAIAYFDQARYDEALTNYEQSLEIRQSLGDSVGMAESYTNIGNVYYTKGDNPTALKYYRLAVAIEQDAHQQVAVLCNFSIGLARVGKSDSALLIVDSANAIAMRMGTPDLRIAVLGAYVEVYELAGQYQKALDMLKLRVKLNDSLFRSESASQINELDALFQKSENEKEIGFLKKGQELLQKDKEKKDLMIYAFTGGTILLLLVVVLVVRTNNLRKKANLRLEDQNKIIAEKNKDITDSITYARRIQQSVLPDERILQSGVKDYFILNKPRDIVSGDFFWLAKKENRVYIAVADCTGHGVPGALVSVVGLNMLNKIIEQAGTPTPAAILDQLHVLIINALNKDAGARDTQDGMDIGLLCIDQSLGKAWFAGAGRPLFFSPEAGKLELVRGDRYSIAGEKKIDDNPFSQTEIALTPGSKFYLSSDGFADQFGEKTGKKFLSKRFQDLLAAVSALPMKEQKEKVNSEFESWRGTLEQVDDVLVVGISL